MSLGLTAARLPYAAAENPAVRRHHGWMWLATLLAMATNAALAIYGFDYYTLDQAHRVYSPKHAILKPSGTLGIPLGFFGTLLFLLIFLYAFRKRWPWLSRKGNSKHWLDFHILMGILAPLIITFHSAFKFRGIAGMAYWIMVAVALSGFVGRYIYAQIPRSLGDAEVSLKELREASQQCAEQLRAQRILSVADVSALLHLPDPAVVQRMSMGAVLWTSFRHDLALPFRLRRLRRKARASLGRGLAAPVLTSSLRRELENAVAQARQQAALSRRILFLSKTKELFRLWHVVHRPFSYSFAVLACVHIGVALLLGFF